MPFLPREANVTTLDCVVSDPFPPSEEINVLLEDFANILYAIRHVRRTKVRGYPLAGDNKANIDLTTSEEETLRLFMQTGDFYIFGYKNRPVGGIWELRLEDTPKNRRLVDYHIRIRDSVAIGVDESYFNISKLDLSFFAFTEAVNELIRIRDPTGKTRFDVRSHVFKIIMMLIESARSNWIEEFYRDVIINQDASVPMEPWIEDGVNSWSRASTKARECDDEVVVLTPQEEKIKSDRDMPKVWESPRLSKDYINAPYLENMSLGR